MASVKLRRDGALYQAEVVMKRAQGLLKSNVDKALAAADEVMGRQMGTSYKVHDSFSSGYVHIFMTKTMPKMDTLVMTLQKLEGFGEAWRYDSGFGVKFKGEKIPTAADVAKTCGLEVSDLVLAGSQDGKRYYCPKHQDKVSAQPGKCPTGNEDLIAVGATPLKPLAPRPEDGDKPKGGKDG